MKEKIKEVYERINNEFLSISPFGAMNTKNFRTEFKERLENEIVNSVIKCDEENNPPFNIWTTRTNNKITKKLLVD